MQKALSSIFWNFYAFCYDGVRKLKPYQEMLEEVLTELDLKPGMRVLDAGCGTGNLEVLIAERHPDVEVVAVDFSSAMLRRAWKKINSGNIVFAEADLNQPLLFPEKHFDRVVSVNALHALRDPLAAISGLSRLLKLNGKAVLVALKEQYRVPLILKAHQEAKGVDTSKISWESSRFYDWCKLVFRAFGINLSAIQFILIAIFNKLISQNITGLKLAELERTLFENMLDIEAECLVYGAQDLCVVVKKVPYRIKVARSNAELEASLRIRERVFLEESGLPLSDDKDEYDERPETVHFLVEEDGEAMGTFRLLRIPDNAHGFRGLYTLPYAFDFTKSLELSRVAIVPERRRTGLFMLIVKYVNLFAKANGYPYICGTFREELMRFFLKQDWQFDFVSECFMYYDKWRIVAFVSPVEKNIKRFWKDIVY